MDLHVLTYLLMMVMCLFAHWHRQQQQRVFAVRTVAPVHPDTFSLLMLKLLSS